ncbi:hypothetical protein J3B02_004224 [Coemansia erecta]|uniref:Uncharacterized protein n=1 Tax=Coemansia asiatica TaxID=1052880 RepID=A0A9W7XGC2_9FUNG|nr:hypothetical protein LPJ64_005511 [Coemansia asiatica]KAJ2847193.1 hypothetical protein J3B02_004224 [Coemansia erecta]KAJ2872072.1 hypothetical protein FB639_004393 [Coemansia asiatica]
MDGNYQQQYGGANQGYDDRQQYGENQDYDRQQYGGEYQESRGYNNQEQGDQDRNIFVEEDGSVDKSRVFMAGVGALAAGLIGKKIYDHYTEDDEEQKQAAQNAKPLQFYDAEGRPVQRLQDSNGQFIEQPLYNADGTPVDQSFIDKLRNFFMDPDGTVDKSTVFWSVLAATATAYAGKKVYDHYTEEEQQDQYARPPQFFDAEGRPIHQLKGPDGQLIEQPLYNADGTPVDQSFVDRLRNYFRDPDGSLDNSHIFKVLAGAAAVGYGGKKVYEHYNRKEEQEYGRRDFNGGY